MLLLLFLLKLITEWEMGDEVGVGVGVQNDVDVDATSFIHYFHHPKLLFVVLCAHSNDNKSQW